MKHKFIPTFETSVYVNRALKMLRYMTDCDCSDGKFRIKGRGEKLYEINKREMKNEKEFEMFIMFCVHLRNHAEREAKIHLAPFEWDDDDADPVDNYFECIAECDVNNKECETECVEVLKEES